MSDLPESIKGPKGTRFLGVSRQFRRHTLLPFLSKTQEEFGVLVPFAFSWYETLCSQSS